MERNLLVLKLRRRFKNKNHPLPGSTDTSSIADVAFLLLIFFIVTSSFIITQGLYLRLPVEGKPRTVREGRLVVVVPDNEGFTVNSKRYTDGELRNFLLEKKETVPDVLVLLSIGEDVLYQRLVTSMEIARSAGIMSLSLKERRR